MTWSQRLWNSLLSFLLILTPSSFYPQVLSSKTTPVCLAPSTSIKIEYPNLSYPQFLESNLARDGEAVALRNIELPQNDLTYSQLNDRINRLANGLLAQGIVKGDRVALMLPQSPQYILSYLAILKIGAIVIHTNTRYGPVELIRQYSEGKPKAAILLNSYLPRFAEIQRDIPFVQKLIVVEGGEEAAPSDLTLPTIDWSAVLDAGSVERPSVEVGPEDPAVLQYTSGTTTGEPKLVTWTHRTLVAIALQRSFWLYSRSAPHSERVFNVVYNHIGMLSTLAAGMELVVHSGGFSDKEGADVFYVIKTFRPTVVSHVPAGYSSLLTRPGMVRGVWESVKVALSFGSHLPPTLIEKFQEVTGVRILSGLGQAEIPAGLHEPLENPRLGSVGLPMPDVQIRIVDPDTGRDVKRGEAGELWVKGPQRSAGYWNNPEAFAKKLTLDGWVKTGDLVRQDEEGYVYHESRMNDVILLGGYRVLPREVESVLLQHSKVAEAVVVKALDTHGLAQVKAVIIPKAGETLSADEIRDFVRGRLAEYNVPTKVEFVKALPRGAMGKVQRFKLADAKEERLYATSI